MRERAGKHFRRASTSVTGQSLAFCGERASRPQRPRVSRGRFCRRAGYPPTAAGTAALLWLFRANEGAHEAAAVFPRRLDVHGLESGQRQQPAVFTLFQGTGNASNLTLHLHSHLISNRSPAHDVRNGKPPARLQDPKRLSEHTPFVGREIDYAVGDDHIDRILGQWHIFDFSLEKLDILRPRFALVLARELQHLVRHIETVGLSCRTDPPGREQNVDPASGSEVEDGFAFAELREHRGIAAAERRGHGLLRKGAELLAFIKVGGYGIAAWDRFPSHASVLFFDCFADVAHICINECNATRRHFATKYA